MSLRSDTCVGGEEGGAGDPLPQLKLTVPAPFIQSSPSFCLNQWILSISLHKLHCYRSYNYFNKVFIHNT